MTQPRNLSIFADGLNSSGIAAPSVGGTGTGTAFTTGSVVFAGSSGVYNQSNANFFWDNSNIRLGIGTSSPQILLHSYSGSSGNNANTYTTQIRAENNGTAGVSIASPTANQGVISYATPLDSCSGAIVMDGTNRYMAFCTVNATERMRIDSSGNVGIGTTNPSSPGGNINFILNTSGASSIIKSSTTSTGSSAIARFDQSTGTAGAYTIMGLYDNSGNPYWQFAAGSGVTGAVYWTNGSGGVYLGKNATSWTSNSDENLKNITGTIQDGLSKVLSLRAAKFTWKDDDTNTPQVGLIAQDVQKVLPEVVKTNKDGHLGVSYTEVIPLLVAAIQEMQANIVSLSATVSEQANVIAEIKKSN